MITRLVPKFDAARAGLRADFAAVPPDSYADLLERVVVALDDDDLDPKRIHRINDGDYQGTLLFVVGAKGYQPSTYHATSVSYGSCSGCDTFEAIRGYSDDPLTAGQLDDYMTLALHMFQSLRLVTA